MTRTETIQCKNKAAAGVLNGLSLAHIFDHGRAPSLPSSCFTGRAQSEMLAQGYEVSWHVFLPRELVNVIANTFPKAESEMRRGTMTVANGFLPKTCELCQM